MKSEQSHPLDVSRCNEIQLHYKRPHIQTLPTFNSPESAIAIFRDYIDPNRLDVKECMWVLYATHKSGVLGIADIASGGHNQVLIPIREIIQIALLVNATGIIACHNHPAGGTVFSKSDIAFTKKLATAVNLFEISLIDHFIITSESYASFDQSIGFEH